MLYLFWIFNGADSFLHILAGLSLGLFVTALLNSADKKYGLVSIGVALGVGILWEFYEYSAGITSYNTSVLTKTLWDTGSDILMDIIGGLVGFLVYWKYTVRKVVSDNDSVTNLK